MLISSCAATLNNYVQKNVEHNLLRSIIMAALWNRAGYYIYALWFLLLSIFFFSCLFSAVADWMSTILLHIVSPQCEFRMQIADLKRAARGWLKIQNAKMTKTPSWHHRTSLSLSGYIFATKACIDNRKKNSLNSSVSPHVLTIQ